MAQNLFDIEAGACEEVINAQDIAILSSKPLAKMRTNKTRTSRSARPDNYQTHRIGDGGDAAQSSIGGLDF